MVNSTTKLSQHMQTIAAALDESIAIAAGEKIGFTLIVYTPERASYVSNVDRKDAIEQMKHLINLWESDMPDIKAHEIS